MTERPHIGITTSFQEDEQRLRRDYVLAVERAGGIPMPVPMVASAETASQFAEQLDGLIVTGGPAVTQGLIGTLPDDLDDVDPVRDASDEQILDAAFAADLPLLGICYGMQRLNARAGGTIYADVEAQHDGALVHSQKRGASTHPLQIHASTRLRSLLDTDTVTVNTRHLQALADLGDGYRASATAPDGVIEAIEHENGRILGVQFHPERMGDSMQPVFDYLVAIARSTPSESPPSSVDVPLSTH